MSEQQIDAVVALVAGGYGVEAALAKLGIDSTRGTQALKDHGNARTRLEVAKAQAKLVA